MQRFNERVNNQRVTSIRELWYNYKSEILFFVFLSTCVVLGHWLSHWIPVELLNNVILPVQHGANIAVCAVGAWLLFGHADGLRIRKACAWALVAWGLADAGLLVQDYIYHLPVLRIGSNALNAYELLVCNFLGWILLVYPTETLRPGWLNKKRAMYQLLPLLALVVLDYFIPIDLRWVIAGYPAVLFALVVTHLRAYRIWCEENYSSMDDIDVQWVVRYLLMVLLVGISYGYVALSDNPGRVVTQNALLFFLFAYGVEQILFRKDPWEGVEHSAISCQPSDISSQPSDISSQPSDISSQPSDISSQPSEESGTLNSPQDDQPSNSAANKRETIVPSGKEVEKLRQWMEQQKPYVNPDFKLMDLRAVQPMNRTYLSRFIRDEFGCTFYQFVNSYRIAEAKRLLAEQPEIKMAEVAAQCGFSSRTAFYNTFARETGMSPSEWCEKCHNT